MSDFSNRVTKLFGIDYPIIQAGIIWAFGWRLASAVSNAGGLGLSGSGSMYPDVLREHIQKVIEEGVKIVFTSAGNPKTWTSVLKEKGIRVVHVISSSKFARKSEEAGCDAIVAEGFEAGGHNGREETTTMVLIPAVVSAVKIPVIAAGGIATGKQMLAAMVTGAEGVQMGSRFVASEEASSHIAFKNAVIHSQEGDTVLTMKQLTPVRMMRNKFYEQVQTAERNGVAIEELKKLLGKGRAKKGMFD